MPGEFTGGVALTNNYIFRGITQSDDDPAIQGNLNYALETGFAGTSVYGGVWGSNVDFNDGDGAHVELDWSFGLSGEILDSGVKYTLGGIYYSYPSRSEYNYWEVAPTLTYAPLEWLTVLRAASTTHPTSSTARATVGIRTAESRSASRSRKTGSR